MAMFCRTGKKNVRYSVQVDWANVGYRFSNKIHVLNDSWLDNMTFIVHNKMTRQRRRWLKKRNRYMALIRECVNLTGR